MSSAEQKSDRLDIWNTKWNEGDIGFHKPHVHPMLEKHFDKLLSKGPNNKLFIPLCGKSIDIKWIADQNITVVGVDGTALALEQFFSEQNLNLTKESVTTLNEGSKVFKDDQGKIHLYCCDIMEFNESMEGAFDAIWDRGSLVALERRDVQTYVDIMKRLLKPGGRYLMEVMDYDLSIMHDVSDPTKPPPPFPMSESELRSLYEPECSIEHIDREPRKLAERDIHTDVFLLTKKM